MTTTAENLRKAASLLRERGHCKNALEDDDGRLCMIGAWNLAVLGHSKSTPSRHGCADVIMDIVGEQFPDRVPNYILWSWATFNNHDDTTADDVIMVLEKAAARLEENDENPRA